METNALYYGDNLDILRRYVPDGSVDLVYLDPPFSSNRTYSVIFKDESGRGSDAQIEAFDDTWHWGPHAEQTYAYLTNTQQHGWKVPESVSAIVAALRKGMSPSPMLAYLVEMTVRLVELHRVLKPSGSLYLHCDPTASHYLKVVLDAIFGPERFINEVTWRRTFSHGNVARNFGSVSDILLVYSKGPDYTWNPVYTPFPAEYVAEVFRYSDPDGRRWQSVTLRNPAPRPNLRYDYTALNGVTYKPHPNGWLWDRDRLARADAEGRLHYPAKATGALRLKMYLDESQGVRLQNIWDDIRPVGALAAERQGYPTQKPVALLERVLAVSSNPGDVVLDPFCGCGTALVAAEKMGRHWVGIDITYLSVAVMRARLHDSFPALGPVKVIGQPTEVEGARMLAQQSLDGRYEFQYWALSLVDAQPSGQKKKGADSGIDGKVTFSDLGGTVRDVLVEVKSGHVDVSQIRSLKGAMEREGAPLGLFLTLEEPSKPMREEAATAGFWHSDLAGRDYPRVQILTIKELLDGKRPQLPLLVMPTYQQAEKVMQAPGQQAMFGT